MLYQSPDAGAEVDLLLGQTSVHLHYRVLISSRRNPFPTVCEQCGRLPIRQVRFADGRRPARHETGSDTRPMNRTALSSSCTVSMKGGSAVGAVVPAVTILRMSIRRSLLPSPIIPSPHQDPNTTSFFLQHCERQNENHNSYSVGDCFGRISRLAH